MKIVKDFFDVLFSMKLVLVEKWCVLRIGKKLFKILKNYVFLSWYFIKWGWILIVYKYLKYLYYRNVIYWIFFKDFLILLNLR